MKFDDPKWQETVDAQTLSDLKATLKVLADDAWVSGYGCCECGHREEEAEADRRVEVSKASILRLVDSIMRTSRAKNQTRKSNRKHRGDEMMWTKTGEDTWRASNGSGFVAHVRDMEDHFLVSTPGAPGCDGLSTRMVEENSLDALKIEVQRMAIESLVAS